MRPSHEMTKKAHDYVKRADGTMGYEERPEHMQPEALAAADEKAEAEVIEPAKKTRIERLKESEVE